jgi:hypothetical protein
MDKPTDNHLIDWLLEYGGPVVRYRTLAELADNPASTDLRRAGKDLLACRLVQQWLDCLKPGRIHNSKDTDFENSMGKLLEFGLRAGMKAFDCKTLHFRRWLASGNWRSPERIGGRFSAAIVAAGLTRAGYAADDSVRAFWLKRLDDLCDTIRRFGHDIYIDADTFGDMPKAWKVTGRPLVNPEISSAGKSGLPRSHDLYGLSALPDDAKDRRINTKINTVVRYVLAPEHQSLEPGYGLMRHSKGRYYAIGWRTDLPGYEGFDFSAGEAKVFVQRVELMAHFSEARKHVWFKNAVKHLEGFRTERGSYLFPRPYLQEARNQYWVSGAHMGLEEDRRRPQALELESTFRMLRIKRLAAGK